MPRNHDRFDPGTRIEIRSTFDRGWKRGFEVDGVDDGGYTVRRLSDGSVLPAVFPFDQVRVERRKEGLWWYR